jgi:C1A family cysteine protease
VSSSGGDRIVKVGSPSSLDWREQGAVTPVKAQGSCGTCWSFTTVAMCESSRILQGKAFNNRIIAVDLSEQYLLKCTPGSSCSGGYLENSIDKAIESGLPYENQFPYDPYGANNNGICSTRDLLPVSNGSRISKYYTTDDVIIAMVTQGPIALAVSATGWESYSSGTYQCPAIAPINHAVLLVGYTPDYWIIKNSWGANWGQNGFIYVTRNPLYNCGIGTAVHSLSGAQLPLLTALLIVLAAIIL